VLSTITAKRRKESQPSSGSRSERWRGAGSGRVKRALMDAGWAAIVLQSSEVFPVLRVFPVLVLEVFPVLRVYESMKGIRVYERGP
jgi:hypothetical protein